MSTQYNSIISKLKTINFKNKGIVKKDMIFEYRSRPCHYMEDVNQWATRYGGSYYNYLYLIKDGKEMAPPCGMRSSVPLGGLGAGTVELRADGSLKDWNIFNNSPAGGQKVQLDEAIFYIWIKEKDKNPVMKTLRTHPPSFLPAIDQIEYSGAYPVTRLVFSDKEIPIKITLYAFSEFSIYNEQESAAPAVIFTFVLENPTNKEIDVSLMFVLPNAIKGEYSIDGNKLILKKEGTEPDSGTMIMKAVGKGFSVSGVKADSLFGIQRDYGAYGEFPEYMRIPQKENPIDGAVGRMYYIPRQKNYGSISAKAKLKSKEIKEIKYIMAWYFPYRFHAGEILGNYYVNIYKSVEDVADKVVKRIPKILETIQKWHSLCFDNSLPEWFQDAMVNSVATIAKTGMWFRDGRWRQWESFSCPAVDPIHIQFYRILPYAWFFTKLRRSQMYGYKACQLDDGYIQENLGRATGVLDKPIGRMMGDGCTVFILQAYQDYLWTGDKKFFNDMWPAVKKAVSWQIERSKKLGLPHNLNNTYDWWAFDKKDIVSNNAFLHLAALLAAERMGKIIGDDDFASKCKQAFYLGQKTLNEKMWNGSYYLAWKNFKEQNKNTLLSDTLYGQLWAEILGLGLIVDKDKLIKHLENEKHINGTPYGLKVMYEENRENDAMKGILYSNNKEKPRDNIVWEAGSLDWCALNIFINGDVNESLKEAEKICRKWQDQLHDQWDIRDLTTAWNGEPYCNSHYARQLILWAIPLALSGQQYTAVEGILSFKPKIKPPAKIPFMTPQACGILEICSKKQFVLHVISGCLKIKELYIEDSLVAENIILKENNKIII